MCEALVDDGFAACVSTLRGIVSVGIPALFHLGMCEVLGYLFSAGKGTQTSLIPVLPKSSVEDSFLQRRRKHWL